MARAPLLKNKKKPAGEGRERQLEAVEWRQLTDYSSTVGFLIAHTPSGLFCMAVVFAEEEGEGGDSDGKREVEDQENIPPSTIKEDLFLEGEELPVRTSLVPLELGGDSLTPLLAFLAHCQGARSSRDHAVRVSPRVVVRSESRHQDCGNQSETLRRATGGVLLCPYKARGVLC